MEILAQIKEAYEIGDNYFSGEHFGEPFKIRMNKDHGRNSHRNDDQRIHNLSLVNVKDNTLRVIRKSGNYFQWQIDGIYFWEQAEEEILEFLYQIEQNV